MRKIRPPFLPDRSHVGWTPYAWLIYLPTFYVAPVGLTQSGRAEWWLWPATILATLVFLVTYFRAYWVRGRRLVQLAAVQAGIGLLFAPINPGAAVFFVYAGSFLAQLDDARHAVRGVLAVAALGVVAALLSYSSLIFALVAVGITIVVSGVNLHYTQQGKTQRKLRLAHEEIEQLAAIAERERIARDLHDVLGHTLSLIVLKAELAVQLADVDAARATAEMRDVENVARTTLQEVRQAIRGYRASLSEELERGRAMLKAARIHCVVDARHERLAGETDETLSLAVREAVTNVVRHSEASHCVIRTTTSGSTVILDVIDDGRGMTAQPGLGLRGMKERVEAAGGTLTVANNGGAQLRIQLPLRAGAPPAERAPAVMR